MRSLSAVLLFVSLTSVLVNSIIPSLNDDVLGLIVFKADIQDPAGKLASWNEEDDSPCNWVGVKCNPRSNRVSELSLEGFSLSGKLSKGLLQLRSLQKLSLARNNLTGGLTLSLSQFPSLTFLDLRENGITGYIPSDFFTQCGSLRSISLASNAFSGPIPESLSSCVSLVSLNFSSNQLSGSLPLGLWSLSGLKSLDLSNNLLEDHVPEGINRLSSLRVLNLRNNRFTGEIPGGIGRCLLLRYIDLSQNSFHGFLPSAIRRLSLCNNLILGGNKFTAELPAWIGDMVSVEFLDLSSNNFSGTIPASLGKLKSLKFLNISHNALSGIVPEAVQDCVNLLVLDLSHNYLTSSLPSWLFTVRLQQVLVSNNGFSGSLDDAFASSVENSREKLLTLDVSLNKLSGEIPAAIGSFSSLDFLDLSENAFNGSIPISIGDCSALVSLFLARNQFTGPIPGSLAKLTHLEDADLSSNKLTGTLPKQLSDLVNLEVFNISHNELQGELPGGAFFDTINPLLVSGNPALCGAAVRRSCPTVLPKPLVLNPNSTDATPGSMPSAFGAGKKILSISALIAIGAATAIVLGVVGITILNLRARAVTSNSAAPLNFSGGDDFSSSPSSDSESGKLVMFSGDPCFRATAHALLNKDCELGRGGFGAVYKTMLGNGRPVAIKKLTVSSIVKSQQDFEREVRVLGKVRHSNLVALDGYYWTPSLQLLIYEFVSGGNLYERLHQEPEGGHLPWDERFNIMLGAARGLAHLHQMNIIHYNIKSSNILIDSKGEAKVADYGLARLLPMLDRYVLSSKIQCALGYMAPEFACNTVKITEKCDVYGFGILVLEMVSGKRPVEYMEDDVVVLADMIRGAVDEGRVEECVDRRLQGKFPVEVAVKLALACTSHVPSSRPKMSQVVTMLERMKCTSASPSESPRFQ